MGKISKKDQDPKMVEKTAIALAELARRKSQHFAVGTFINQAGRGSGEILMHRHCKYRRSETKSLIKWDSGEQEWIFIRALNPSVVHHG